MSQSRDLQAFQTRIGHDFADLDLLRRALTHTSIASATRPSNQRLEFLGDRVLNLVIAEALLEQDTVADEGILAPRYNALVRKETCADVARDIDLGAVLRLGRGEMATGGRRKNAILGDAMEALIAAVYIDAGMATAQSMVRRLWGKRISQVEAEARDAKTALQEWAQARGMTPPSYQVVDRSGPDHAPVFRVRVQLQDGQNAEAEASAKRPAEQAAAKHLLTQLDS